MKDSVEDGMTEEEEEEEEEGQSRNSDEINYAE